jgi:hypothetical protein
MLAFYRIITHALGARRRIIRRVAALCLVVMGVHLAADHLDDLMYPLLDAVDLLVDDAVAGLLAWLADAGGMTPAAALWHSDSFATFIDLGDKDKLAIALALSAELLLDILLLDLAWGRHLDDESTGILEELTSSARQMVEALRPLDLERLVVMPTLTCYALGGALLSALAVEQVVRDLVQRVAETFLWGGQLAAAVGILAGSLLLWRFLPDLLHGALLRSRLRHDRARERAMARFLEARRCPRLARAVLALRLGSRGTWLLVFALPLAVAGVFSDDLTALLQRTEVAP